MTHVPFDAAAARRRCRGYRRRLLDVSQRQTALHLAPAFSCLEILDTIYFGLMRRDEQAAFVDTFLLSKGHGAIAQYAVLEELGILERHELDRLCSPQGRLGAHPDYGTPGVEASTGSLGHGLPLAVGMALADKSFNPDRRTHVVMSDGELEEGSVWEAALLAATFGLRNLVAFVDLNDFQSLGKISEIHPSFYPVPDKWRAFGWDAVEVDGHDPAALYAAATDRHAKAPTVIIARTTKGKGISFMENVPIWHYRAPSPGEYQQALTELEATA